MQIYNVGMSAFIFNVDKGLEKWPFDGSKNQCISEEEKLSKKIKKYFQ